MDQKNANSLTPPQSSVPEPPCPWRQPQETAVILAAGDYPTRLELRALLERSGRVVCCDSAAEAFIRHTGRTPWRIVGDLDSLTSGLREQYADIIVHEREQETNDLSKAMRYVRAQGISRVLILGATGRREDHTLGNISLLIEFLRQGFDTEMLTDYGRFIPCSSSFAACLPLGTQLSIFSFGATGFRAAGLRYPLHDFSNWWEGTLNETTSAEVSVNADGDFLVYIPHAPQ